MLERDESSRLLGWPLGVSSEIALLDSAPIFRAVVEKDSADTSNNGTLYSRAKLLDVFSLVFFYFSYTSAVHEFLSKARRNVCCFVLY